MSAEVKFRRGTNTEHSTFTGAAGEATIDTTNNRWVVQDGVSAGGKPQASAADIQNQPFNGALAVGTNTITLTASPAPAAFATYQKFYFEAANTNTSSVTLNVNGLGAKTIKKISASGLVALVAGDIQASGIYEVTYDGTNFLFLGAVGGGGVIEGTSLVQNPYATNTIVTQAHALAAMPDMLVIEYECKVANLGWSIGDIIEVSHFWTDTAFSGAAFAIEKNTTNVVLRTNNTGTNLFLPNKSTLVVGDTATTSWKLRIRPFKLV